MGRIVIYNRVDDKRDKRNTLTRGAVAPLFLCPEKVLVKSRFCVIKELKGVMR